MPDEKVIIDIEYNTGEAQREVDKLTDEIIDLSEANKRLSAGIKDVKKDTVEGQKARKETLRLIEKNKEAIRRARAERTKNIKAITGEKSAFDKLTESVKEGNKIQQKNLDTLQQMPGGIGRVSSAFKRFTQIMKANPIILIVGAIVGAFAGLFKLFKQNDKFGTEIEAKFNGIKAALAVAAQAVRSFALAFGQLFKLNFKKAGELFQDAFRQASTGAREAFDATVEYTIALDALNDDILLSTTRHSKLRAEIEKNLVLAKDQVTSDKERLKFSKLAFAQTRILYMEEIEFSKRRYELELDNIYALAKAKNNITKEEFRQIIQDGKRRDELTLQQNDAWNELGDDRIKLLVDLYNNQFLKEEEFSKRSKRLISELSGLQKKVNKDVKQDNIETYDDIILATEEVTDELAGLYKEDFDNWREQQHKKYAGDTAEEIKEAKIQNEKELLQISQDYLNESLELFGANYDERYNIANRFTNSLLELQKKRLNGEKITLEDIAIIAKGLTNDILTNRQNALSAELEAVKTNYGNQINAFEEGSEIRKELERKQARAVYEIQLKQFKLEKAQALINVAINTALAAIKVTAQTGIGAAVAIPVVLGLGAAQAALIASKKPPEAPSFKKGGELKTGIFSGKRHSHGGTNLRDDSGRLLANVEKGERFFVLNRNASSKIRALSDINESTGGKAFAKRRVLQDGGEVDTRDNISEILSKINFSVKVEDIKTGINDYDKTINAGVV